jgi:predicted Fe-S protein YdhL (DUF1289 family)
LTDLDKPVGSPCVGICALDDEDLCTGCQRSIDEIRCWSRMDNQERRQVLLRCHERARANGQLF